MQRLIAFIILALFAASPAFAMSEKDFNTLYNTSEEFRQADKILNTTWKQVNSNIDEGARKHLLQMQRDWLKSGRDDEARSYMKMGYNRDCAYAKATRKWAKTLEVFEYNANLPEDETGRAKADDAFWEENDDEIPPHCRAR